MVEGKLRHRAVKEPVGKPFPLRDVLCGIEAALLSCRAVSRAAQLSLFSGFPLPCVSWEFDVLEEQNWVHPVR